MWMWFQCRKYLQIDDKQLHWIVANVSKTAKSIDDIALSVVDIILRAANECVKPQRKVENGSNGKFRSC